MTQSVKPPVHGRRYDSDLRSTRAAATRRAILAAARDCFTERGYAAGTVADIASRAGVAVDTVYASVGKKPEVLRELVETALSGKEQAVPAQERDYVRQITAARSAARKLTIYATAITAIQQRMAPIFRVLQQAATTDPDCSALWTDISERRAANMMEFAADLRRTGELRTDLTDREVADIAWSMNATEYWLLLVHERGWSPQQFQRWLVDCWTRVLLDDPSAG